MVDWTAGIDYEGQLLATKIYRVVILAFAAVGFVVGYAKESFYLTVLISGAGFVLACILCLPPWPMYRRNPLPWQPVQEDEESRADGQAGSEAEDEDDEDEDDDDGVLVDHPDASPALRKKSGKASKGKSKSKKGDRKKKSQ